MSRPASTRPDGGRMYRAVADTLRSLQLRPEHAALQQLARELARLLDDATAAGRGADAYHKLGPRLTAVLRELGATPATGARGDGDDDERDAAGEQELDELSARRRTRPDRAAGVDPAAP